MKIQRLSVVLLLSAFFPAGILSAQNLKEQANQAMLDATRYMVEEVSTNGGYLSHYTEDFSRRWGELESYDTQIWLESSRGTIGLGDLFLDLYQATGNEYYYQAAKKVAGALIWGQHESGGWNYIVDFAGDRSLKQWYDTIGKNAWGFEEYYHYYGNATMDDFVSAGAAEYLLRIYLEKMDPAFKPALNKAIDFILESQYPLGGWPQRYPLRYEFSKNGLPDYSSFYTFNDGVTENNIEFLIKCYAALGEERFLDPIRRGMNFYLITQQGNPQGGWGLQHNMELEPASARSFEPASLSPGTTYRHARLMMDYYRYTGDRKFLARIPDVIAWLEQSRLSGQLSEDGRYTHSTFVEIGTDRPLFVHREGTGVDGRYWVDYSDEDVIRHYGSKTSLDIEALEEEFNRVNAMSPEEAAEDSPLLKGRYPGEGTPQENVEPMYTSTERVPDDSEVRDIIRSLDEQGRWLTTGEWISDPHSVSGEGRESNTAMHSDRFGSAIRDTSDQQYISTGQYRENMILLKNYVSQ
ncbi:MAG: pectate lyase [Balneolaceae bacterium]